MMDRRFKMSTVIKHNPLRTAILGTILLPLLHRTHQAAVPVLRGIGAPMPIRMLLLLQVHRINDAKVAVAAERICRISPAIDVTRSVTSHLRALHSQAAVAVVVREVDLLRAVDRLHREVEAELQHEEDEAEPAAEVEQAEAAAEIRASNAVRVDIGRATARRSKALSLSLSRAHCNSHRALSFNIHT